MSLKKTITSQGMKLMSDPRVMKLMQNEGVLKAVMAAAAVPGRVEGFSKEQRARLAKAMQLATSREVNDLRRTVRSLEDQIAELRSKGGGGGSSSGR